MGTKNNPGRFDCYANAAPDEPMFILLGRDRHAAILVELWTQMRVMEGETTAVCCEAAECADALRDWNRRMGKTPVAAVAVMTALARILADEAEEREAKLGEARARLATRDPRGD